MSMLNRIIGTNKRRPVHNNDEIVEKPVYKNQPTDIADTKLVLQIVDLEQDIKIIHNKYKNCTNDPIRQKLLWRMFLEKSNSLSLLKNQNDHDNSTLLKVMYKNVTNPDNVKSGKKIYKRLEKYNGEYSDRSNDSCHLAMHDDDFLKSEFMSSTIENLGLSQDDDTLTDDVVPPIKEEEEEEGETDCLPDLPDKRILMPAWKSSSYAAAKTVTFNINNYDSEI